MRPTSFHVLGGLALCAALCSCGSNAPSLSSFSVTPSTVVIGVPTTVTISFAFANTPSPAPACAIDGLGPVTDGMQTSITLNADTTLTLRCSNASGQSMKEATVTVTPPVAPQLGSFTTTPTSVVIGAPTDVTWTWSYGNAPAPLPACTINRNVGAVTPGATTSVTLTTTSTFTLTCTNVAGTATADVSITAVPAPVAPSLSTFLANPSSVYSGDPTSIQWSWTYSAAPNPSPTCSIDHGVGTVTNASSTTVTQTADTTYTLTCTNAAGSASKQVTVTATPVVTPALATFDASPTSALAGQTTTVTWTWTFSNSPSPTPVCSIDQGVGVLISGAMRDVTLAADTVFTLTCQNVGGSTTRQVTITVVPLAAPAIATFTASPSGVASGVSTNIQWSWTYSNTPNPADTCSIDQGVGAVTNGQVTSVNITAARTYTLTCTNSQGNGTKQATITIVPQTSIANGTFETGTLAGWTSAGSTSAVTGGRSGTYAAQTGLTTATTGPSSISQTFTVQSGVTTLSFWYQVVCLDTVTYDWATATLKNNSTGVTTTVLAPVCSNTGAWQQVTAPVTAGTSYTLTLSNVDDGSSSDPTYTLYDDVVLQ